MQNDVFIAYSHRDMETVEKVERQLVASGLRCFRDTTSIPGSEKWVDEIAKELRNCHAVVVIVSQGSVFSENVQNEIRMAKQSRKAIIPVLLSKDFTVPGWFELIVGGHQYTYAVPSIESVLTAIGVAAWRAVDRAKYRKAYKVRDDVEQKGWGNCQCEVNFSEDRCGAYVGECEDGKASIENDEYLLMAKPGRWIGTDLPSLPRLMDAVVDVRMRKCEGGEDVWFGLEFGARYPGDYYQCLLNPQGTVRVARHLAGEWTDLALHHRIRHAHQGDQENDMLLVRSGSNIVVFLNGFHALTVEDGKIRLGRVGLVVGPGSRVGFKGLRVTGMAVEKLFADAMAYWDQLETLESRKILNRIAECDPGYCVRDGCLPVSRILWEPRPDRHKTVLIVVGGSILPQLYDGVAAARLRDEINRRGNVSEAECAAVVTDVGLAEAEPFMQCPLIVLGGPYSNRLTREWTHQMPFDPAGSNSVRLQHSIDSGERRVLLWGNDGQDTATAVDSFVSLGLLDRFLTMLWKRPVVKCVP